MIARGLDRLAKIAKPSLEVRIFFCKTRHFFRVKLCHLRYFRRVLLLLVYYCLAQAWNQGLRILRVYLQFCHETLKTAYEGGNLRNNFLGRHAQGCIRGAAEPPANLAFREVTLYDAIEKSGSKTGTASKGERRKTNRTQHRATLYDIYCMMLFTVVLHEGMHA